MNKGGKEAQSMPYAKGAEAVERVEPAQGDAMQPAAMVCEEAVRNLQQRGGKRGGGK